MSRNVIIQMEQYLSPESLDLIQKAGALAAEKRLGIYLVGGVVRDILLGRANSDLDLVVEGIPSSWRNHWPEKSAAGSSSIGVSAPPRYAPWT